MVVADPQTMADKGKKWRLEINRFFFFTVLDENNRTKRERERMVKKRPRLTSVSRGCRDARHHSRDVIAFSALYFGAKQDGTGLSLSLSHWGRLYAYVDDLNSGGWIVIIILWLQRRRHRGRLLLSRKPPSPTITSNARWRRAQWVTGCCTFCLPQPTWHHPADAEFGTEISIPLHPKMVRCLRFFLRIDFIGIKTPFPQLPLSDMCAVYFMNPTAARGNKLVHKSLSDKAGGS